MNSKLLGYLLVLGPLLAMGSWFTLPDTEGLTAAEEVSKLIENESQIRIVSIVSSIGVFCMFFGLYFLSRTLRNGSKLSDACAQLGGLSILLVAPIMFLLQGWDLAAIELGKTDMPAAATVVNAGTGFESHLGLLFGVGMLLLGVALTVQKTFHIVVPKAFKFPLGYILIITAIGAILDSIMVDANDIIPTVGWLGMFLMTVVMGILSLRTPRQIEN